MKKLTLSVLALASFVSPLAAAPRAQLLVEGLNKPIFMTAPQGSKDYHYIVEKEGTIRLFDRAKSQLIEEPFLDISDRIKIHMNEQGLLGMAFSPEFSSNGRFYVYYTNLEGDTCISRFTSKSDADLTVDSRSEEVLITQKQDFKNHNGGWIGFGPDKMLYIAFGDGGSANDPRQRAQDLTTYLGKLLRIDVSARKGYTVPADNPFVNHTQARPEILSYGLRNPWRCSWHHDELIIADVGQNLWEEVNVVPRKELFSANFGWPQLEGTHATKNAAAKEINPGEIISPVYEYRHGGKPDQGYSLTGGYVYEGSVESLKGRYFFADYVIPNIWSAELKNGEISDVQNHAKGFQQNGKSITQISAFAKDSEGELYIISHNGQIYSITE